MADQASGQRENLVMQQNDEAIGCRTGKKRNTSVATGEVHMTILQVPRPPVFTHTYTYIPPAYLYIYVCISKASWYLFALKEAN